VRNSAAARLPWLEEIFAFIGVDLHLLLIYSSYINAVSLLDPIGICWYQSRLQSVANSRKPSERWLMLHANKRRWISSRKRKTRAKSETTSREESKSKKGYVGILPALQPEKGDLQTCPITKSRSNFNIRVRYKAAMPPAV